MCQTTAEKYSINTYKGCLAAELSSTCLLKHLIFMEVTQYVVTAHRRDELHHLFLYRNMITAMQTNPALGEVIRHLHQFQPLTSLTSLDALKAYR